MRAPPHVLAFDLGTSSLKAALVSATGHLSALESRPLRLLHIQGGGVEQSPDEWWSALRDAARSVLLRAGGAASSIAAVSVSSQWSGTVAVDARLEPLCDALVWLDARGADAIARAVRGLVNVRGYGLAKLARFVRLTGGLPGLAGKDTIAHILYLKEARPAIYAAAHHFLEPMDYLNARLCGRAATSFATAALSWATDNRDLARVRYDDVLVRRLGVAHERLPELRPSASVLGGLRADVAVELGLTPETPVVLGTPDVHTAAIGAGTIADCDAHLCLGTSSWFCAHTPHKKTDLGRGMASLPSAMPERYLLIAAQESAALCLTWLRDNVLTAPGGDPEALSFAELDRCAANAPAGSGGVIFAPWLNGERMPVDDQRVRAAFVNLSLTTTRDELVRAVLEGVAFNTRWLLLGVERFLGRRLPAITIVGGGASSDPWCQVFADVLDRPIRRVEAPRWANVRGAGLIGAVAIGAARFTDVPALVPIDRVFEPNGAHRTRYDALFGEYLHLYEFARRLAAAIPGTTAPRK